MRPGPTCARSSMRSARATSRASGSPRTGPARRASSACAPNRPTSRSSTSARSCAPTWTGSSPPSRSRPPVLAYLFWHRPRHADAADEYEQAEISFHRSLAHRPPVGLIGSAVFRLDELPWAQAPADGAAASQPGPAYEDWYLVEDFAALGVLNEAAVGRGHRTSHDLLARRL